MDNVRKAVVNLKQNLYQTDGQSIVFKLLYNTFNEFDSNGTINDGDYKTQVDDSYGCRRYSCINLRPLIFQAIVMSNNDAFIFIAVFTVVRPDIRYLIM